MRSNLGRGWRSRRIPELGGEGFAERAVRAISQAANAQTPHARRSLKRCSDDRFDVLRCDLGGQRRDGLEDVGDRVRVQPGRAQ
jgi:hypothetical protein